MPIQEEAIWESEILQIPVGAPVNGGNFGPVNVQAQDLANRTLWLKENKLGINDTAVKARADSSGNIFEDTYGSLEQLDEKANVVHSHEKEDILSIDATCIEGTILKQNLPEIPMATQAEIEALFD